MEHTLYIGDKLFSSWSLRGWLMLKKFGIPFQERMVGLYAGTMADDLAPVAPAKTVPVLQCPDGSILTDSIAMAETLAELYPDHGFYPKDPHERALARSMVAEMHSGFTALRADCPMQLSHVWVGYKPSDQVRADLARIARLWSLAQSSTATPGAWLFGDYTLADVFYAPVAMRIEGYDLPVSAAARAYVDLHLSDPALKKWRSAALEQTYQPFPYPQPLDHKDWPT